MKLAYKPNYTHRYEIVNGISLQHTILILTDVTHIYVPMEKIDKIVGLTG